VKDSHLRQLDGLQLGRSENLMRTHVCFGGENGKMVVVGGEQLAMVVGSSNARPRFNY
jgi:hypothetical protein